MKTRYMIIALLLLVLTLAHLVNQNLPKSVENGEYLERHVEMRAALDKTKTFDGLRHTYGLVLRVQINKDDLFLFEEEIGELQNIYYKWLMSQSGKMSGAANESLRIAFLERIKSKGIKSKYLVIKINQD